MMLWSPELAVVPVTIHLPLKDIFKQLSTELIVETGRIVARDLASAFGIAHPRLAIAGLNPHAGEDGTLGEEDRTIVAPAVARLVAEGIDARGPLPADSMFHERARASYDAALCMYHDQALIPIKTLAFDHAVNVTLGLPFVRTSPDHGTAFDIAGTGTRRSDEPDRGAAPGGTACRRRQRRGAARLHRERARSTACRRCARSSAGTVSSPRNRSDRISCSTSISPRASRARRGRSPASPSSRSAPDRAG